MQGRPPMNSGSCVMRAKRSDIPPILTLSTAGSLSATMITGVHGLLYAKRADKVRAFFRDVLELPHVDAGEGWLIFALPPAELGVHPTDGGEEHHELYLM